jgi:translocation and assembly module TamB
VQSATDLTLANNQISLCSGADLRINGNLANPIILGRITLNSGEAFFLGKRYEVADGTVAFNNPIRTQPSLDLNVTTQIEQYNITLRLQGPIDRLATNYTSEPALAPLDITNLIAFGQTTAEQQSSSGGASPTLGRN